MHISGPLKFIRKYSIGQHSVLLGHSVLVFTAQFQVLETVNTNLKVFGLTLSGIKHITSYTHFANGSPQDHK